MRRVAFATLGCKVNRSDTHRLQEALPAGVTVVPFTAEADLYVVNTCTVTGMADRESRQLIHRAHRRNPEAQIVVTGCLADRAAEEVTLPGVVAVVPNAGKATLAERLAEWLALPAPAPPASRYVYRPRAVTRPPLKIQDGCDGHCTYCAVAAARGQPRSLPPGEVLSALRAYGAQGCPEVVLAGIDLGSYGRDLDPPVPLADLLGQVLAEPTTPRLRLSSIEVLRLEDGLLGQIAAAGPRVCHHLHIPLQSGADPVLRRMGRPYDRAQYAARIEAARRALPGVAIGADVIAGFPGERDADHQATLELLRSLDLAYLHVFPYSPRPGTPAAAFPDAVPSAEIRARAKALRRLSERSWRAYRESLIGTRTRAVVYYKRQQGFLSAFADSGFAVRLEGGDGARGRLVIVRLQGLHGAGMTGTIDVVSDGALR